MDKTELSKFKRISLVIMPVVLTLSTLILFSFLANIFSLETAFIGYLFYWGFWGVCFPLWLLGRNTLKALFIDNTTVKRISKCDWVLLAIPPGLYLFIAVSFIFFRGLIPEMDLPEINLPSSHILLLVFGLMMVLVNGVLEEVTWRGTFISVFPRRKFLGFIYPAVAFSLWHLSPMIGLFRMRGAANIIETIVLGVVLGLCWGRVAWRRKSIKWSVVSHILANIGHVGLFIYLMAE